MIAISKKKLAGLLTLAIAVTLAIVLPLTLFGGIAASPTEGMTLKGYVTLVKNGEEIGTYNLVMDEGFDNIAYYIGKAKNDADGTVTSFSWIAVGDGTGQTAGETQLQTEFANAETPAADEPLYSTRLDANDAAVGGTGTSVVAFAHVLGTKVWTIKATFIGVTQAEIDTAIGASAKVHGWLASGSDITEAGVFNADITWMDAASPADGKYPFAVTDIDDSEDDMLCYAQFGAVTLEDLDDAVDDSGDTLQITWTFTLSEA